MSKTMKSVVMAACGALSLAVCYPSQAGQLNKTRLVYANGEKDASITYTNTGAHCMGVYVWTGEKPEVDPSRASAPFVLKMPPKFAVGPSSSQAIRLSYMGDQPEGTESLYWLTTYELILPPSVCEKKSEGAGQAEQSAAVDKALAERSKSKDISASLDIAIATHIKMLVRPKSLKGSYAEATQQLQWQLIQAQGKTYLQASNPTGYHIHLSKVTLNGHELKPKDGPGQSMATPRATVAFDLGGAATSAQNKVVANMINDQGGTIERQWSL